MRGTSSTRNAPLLSPDLRMTKAARDLSVGDRVIYWKPIPGGLLLKQYATITDRRGVRFKLQRDLTKRPVWVKAWSLLKIDKV